MLGCILREATSHQLRIGMKNGSEEGVWPLLIIVAMTC
jgi:hypothetical protein